MVGVDGDGDITCGGGGVGGRGSGCSFPATNN